MGYRILLTLGVVVAVSAGPPASVTESHVTWNDANFKGELGNMPLGNGDTAANVWVDSESGDLLAYIAKSDAFDQNSQPIKVARLRYSFDPPLWVKPLSSPAGFTMVDEAIVSQDDGDRIENGQGDIEWKASSWANCPDEGAAACEAQAGCVAFSCTKQGHVTPIFQLARVGLDKAVQHKSDWQLYYLSGPTPAPAPAAFAQTLNLTAGAVDIATADTGYAVRVIVDANAPVLRVRASRRGGAPFTVNASLETVPGRSTAVKQTSIGAGFCETRYDVPDTVLPPAAGSGAAGQTVRWFHRNDYALVNQSGNLSYFANTLLHQGVSPAVMPDPFDNLTFGGSLSVSTAQAAVSSSARWLHAVGAGGASVVIEATVHTAQTATAAGWEQQLGAAVAAEAARLGGDAGAKEAAHEAWWAAFWDRSHIDLPARGAAADDEQRQVESRYVWARYLDACDGRDAKSAIKFNGQAFIVDEGKGADFRQWGACYWFQNTRQPYYNTLAAGDLDIQRPLYAFYLKSLAAAQARVQAQFGENVSGAYWPETTTQFGTYNPDGGFGWGCGTKPAGPSSNTYIRFHTTGSLELALFALDDFAYTADAGVMATTLPIVREVLRYYATRYAKRDAQGKLDMWPAQVLETYQCHDPTSRSACPTNPSTDVAGLRAVLTRALALPAAGAAGAIAGLTDTDRTAWRALLAVLPPLALAPSKKVPGQQAVQPAAAGTPSRQNSENTALYTVHPFRLYGLGKDGLATAQATYADRPNPCNAGWCQDVIDAAMLNLTDDAASMVAARAAVTSEFRWAGYAPHEQDYEPSADHFGFMRTAMHYMLLGPLDDAGQKMLLFPTWPTARWDVDVKLHAPRQTTVEAACINGTLTKLVVTPAARRADIQVLNCANPRGL
eukprot:g388.t1